MLNCKLIVTVFYICSVVVAVVDYVKTTKSQ